MNEGLMHVYVVLIDYCHDVDGYEETETSILGIFSKLEDAERVRDAYEKTHPVTDEDYYFIARVESWGVDNINADEYVKNR